MYRLETLTEPGARQTGMHIMKLKKTLIANAIGLLSAAVVSGASAQLEEVVVTARKKSESLMDSPVAR